MRLISADLDPSRAAVTISIDTGQKDGEGTTIPYVLTYGADPRQAGESPAAYRARLRDWLVGVRREARLMADPQAPAVPVREDVADQVRPAFEQNGGR